MSRNTPPCSWTFSTSCFFFPCSGIRDTVNHPYISTCFCGKHLYFPSFFTFHVVQAAWHVNTSHVHASWTNVLYRATNTCLNMTVCMTFHVPKWAMHPARLDGLISNVKCIQKYPLEMHIRNGRTLTNVGIANLHCKQHCPYHVHYAVNNSAEHYQKNPWPERDWQVADHDLEDLCVCLWPIVSQTYFIS